MDTWTEQDEYEADKAYALHKMQQQARRDHEEWRRAFRNNLVIFTFTLAGWAAGFGLWWLGGKIR